MQQLTDAAHAAGRMVDSEHSHVLEESDKSMVDLEVGGEGTSLSGGAGVVAGAGAVK